MTTAERRERFAERLERLGAAMRVLRARRQLTQRQVAVRVGVSPNLVGRLETGTANPTFTTIARVIAGLDATFAELADAYDELQARRSGTDNATEPEAHSDSAP